MSDFIFVRHGQSEANAAGIIADSRPALTEAGIEQARKTAGEVKGLGVTTIVCSPYLRAQQTAETIAGELGIPVDHIEVIDELRERGLGDLEAKPKTYDSEWYSSSDDPRLEPKQDLLDRSHAALKKIMEHKAGGPVLVVGHAVFGVYLLAAANGIASVTDMNSHAQLANADFIEVTVKSKP